MREEFTTWSYRSLDPSGTDVTVNEIRMLKSNLGAEDWTGMPLDQLACAVIQRELKRTRTKSKSVRRDRCTT